MPLIQLDFENKLNTSVQTGDVAYFSNPIDYGTAGNSLNNGDQWSSTTTPHLTSNQSDIIKIGVIETIIPWDGEVNSIICDMPQNLFNQYFSQIQAPVCTTTPPTTIITPGTGSGDCANYAPILDADPVIASTIPGTTPSGLSNYAALGGFQSNNNHFKWFFDNPTVNFSDRSFHVVGDGPGGCPVDPSKQGFISGFDNNWRVINSVSIIIGDSSVYFGDINGNPIYLYDNSIPGFTNTVLSNNVWQVFAADDTFQDIFNWVDLNFPGVTNSSMTYDSYFNALSNYGVPALSYAYSSPGGTAPSTTTTPGTTTCAGTGSFIMFSKDNKVNLSSALGYYASVTFKNNSTEKAELFNVGADVFESSK